jgi:hypothetical protein
VRISDIDDDVTFEVADFDSNDSALLLEGKYGSEPSDIHTAYAFHLMKSGEFTPFGGPDTVITFPWNMADCQFGCDALDTSDRSDQPPTNTAK